MTFLKSLLFVLIISLAISIYYIKNLKEVLSQKELMLYPRVEALEYRNHIQEEAERAEMLAAEAVLAQSKAKESEKIALRVLAYCIK